jgi:hypothetical protein
VGRGGRGVIAGRSRQSQRGWIILIWNSLIATAPEVDASSHEGTEYLTRSKPRSRGADEIFIYSHFTEGKVDE